MTLAEQLKYEGMQQGMQQGIQQGMQNGIRQVAANLLRRGLLSLQQVAEITGLSPEETNKLYKEINAVKP